MDDATTARTAFDETVVFLSYFKDLKDPRQQTVVDIALFGCKKCVMVIPLALQDQ
jgi:hypothetical protein